MVRKLGRIVKDEHGLINRGSEALPRAMQMARQYLLFTHTLVGQKPIGCFRARPVLAGNGILPPMRSES